MDLSFVLALSHLACLQISNLMVFVNTICIPCLIVWHAMKKRLIGTAMKLYVLIGQSID